MKWLEISIRVKAGDVDVASCILEGVGTGGAVIEDPALIYDVVSRGNRETVAMEALVDPSFPPVVKGYLPVDDRLSGRLASLNEALDRLDSSYRERLELKETDDSNWLNRWREFYHPIRVGRRLMVKPSWEDAGPVDGLLVVEVDPGMAFGCGTHPTTSLCMCLLEDVMRGGEEVLDVGTGSGILAITAAKLGAAGVMAVDSDETAVRTARQNVELNGLAGVITVREGRLLDGVSDAADVIVANIVADVVIELLPSAIALLRPGGKLIASGIIDCRRNRVAAALAEWGFTVLKACSQGEWTAYLAVKK